LRGGDRIAASIPLSAHYSCVTPFRAKPFARHKAKCPAKLAGTKLRFSREVPSGCDLCCGG
jgi:hypothetical protein